MGDFQPRARPGKTSPRLYRDLLDYDLRRSRPDGKHLLIDPPPIYRNGGQNYPPRTLPQDCIHQLWRKDGQSFPPRVDEQPNTGSKYISSSYCGRCLYHFDVIADLSRRPGRDKPCQLNSSKFPLHHFQHFQSKARDVQREKGGDKYDNYKEVHSFFCTAPDCPIVIDIRISPPRLNKEHLSPIWDPAKVFRRGQRAIQEQPDRYRESRLLSPIEVLNLLRTYLSDALSKSIAQQKWIAVRNKSFLLAFSDECDDIFEYLDFTPRLEPSADGKGEDKYWVLPAVNPPSDNDFAVRFRRHFIEDVICELSERISENSTELTRLPGHRVYNPLPAGNDIQSTIGCLGYPRSSRFIHSLDEQEHEHPHYGGLGAIHDFADDLISFAYDRQRDCDPQNSPYYLECLQGIGNGRNSSDLQEKSVLAISMGEHTLTEIDNAYKYLAIDLHTNHGDDYIIGVYKSRIESAPRQRDEAKGCLMTIGQARQSAQIQAVASGQEMSFEEALEYLNVMQDTSPDSIEAVAITMALDGDKERVARALRVIGRHRNEYSMELFATSIESGDSSGALNVAEAYRRLQIGDQNMRDESVLTYYQSLCANAPAGSKASYTEALRTIATSRDSPLLRSHINDPNAPIVIEKGSADQPVGLDNIGNTCYLNSLLQYYYTVKPVRDIVMNFSDYRMVLNVENMVKKRVGGRAVARGEIIKAQNFIEELQNLFQNLKSAPSRSVKPTQDLAELTLFSTATEANFRRASISSPAAPNLSLTSYLDAPNYGPQLPPPPPLRPSPIPVIPEDDIEMVDRPIGDTTDQGDSSSDATLVDLELLAATDSAADKATKSHGRSADGTKDHVIEVNANEPDYLLVSTDADADKQVVDLMADESHQPTNVDSQGDEIMTNGSAVTSSPIQSLPSPEKPPPVPPRSKPAPISTSRESEESLRAQKLYFGAQQDVTEVIGNVMFRLQCAIKPTSIDPKFGEQIDGIRETFYGSNAVHLKKGETYDVKIEDWANIIVFPSPSGPRSIYEALDVVFDEQVVEIDNKPTTQYASISKLPPIFQTQIQRTAFDPKTQQASKNQNPIVFEETIYLDRYMDSDKVMQRRREAWKWKSRIRKLEAREKVLKSAQGLPVTDAMDALKEYLVVLQSQEIEGIDVPTSVLEALEARRTELLHELDDIGAEVITLKQKLQDQFTDMLEHRYRLQAVFIHRGTSTYGHYWIYIYDFVQDIWREYNDERVSIVNDRKQIFEQSGNNGPTPYYLVYVRDQDKDDLVDAVCREIVETDEEPYQPAPVPMDGGKEKAELPLNEVQLLDEVNLIDTRTQTLPTIHNLNELVGVGAWDLPQLDNDRGRTW